ncbi:MAG: TIGR02677 family protein [Eubacteriales bacterium]
MQLNSQILKPIEEVKYLATENTWRYRAIIRFFYEQYDAIRYWIYKEEVYEELKKLDHFQNYTIDQCKQDLDTLAEWKNLYAVQDTTKAATIEEFKNKQFRYQLTEYTIEIERMILKLERLHVEGASLEASLLERLKDDLKLFKDIIKKDDKEVGVWWNQIKDNFKRLNENYQDYIRDWQSIKADEMMRTQSFLVFKDKLIEYLRDFIKNLHQYVQIIELILKEISEQEESVFVDKLVRYKLSIPRSDQEQITPQMIEDNILNRWTSLKEWFLGNKNRESEASRLFEMTNEIIRKITRYAVQISEASNQTANRKEEYKKISSLFVNCDSITEAHKLSSYVFGIESPRHLKGDFKKETESINTSVYEEKPLEYSIKPRVRTYREKSKRTPIVDKTEEKEAMRQKIIKQRQEEDEIIYKYIKNNVLDFSTIEYIEPYARKAMLRWLTKALVNINHKGKTENGRLYRLKNPQETESCVIVSEDGEFVMPQFVLVFKEEA